MDDLIASLAGALDRHDAEGAAALFDDGYRSDQPAHPGRQFVGRAQMRANWEAMFAGVPDLRAVVLRSVQAQELNWSEWLWSGTRRDGQPFEMRGVTIFEVVQGHIVSGRLYMEDVERDSPGIEDAVESLSGSRPRQTSGRGGASGSAEPDRPGGGDVDPGRLTR